jgi:hypothetical protein
VVRGARRGGGRGGADGLAHRGEAVARALSFGMSCSST